MRARLVNEAAGSKDIARMESLMAKAKGDQDKEMQYAGNMAKAITNAGKAQARGEAAEQVFGKASPVAKVFFDRAQELGGSNVKSTPSALSGTKGDYSQYAPPMSKRAPRRSGFGRGDDAFGSLNVGIYREDEDSKKRESKHHSGWKGKGEAILPIGRVNLETGKCKYFNVFDTWGDDDTVVEVWQTSRWSNRNPGAYKLIFTSGSKPTAQIGDTGEFKHDQTWARIFDGKMVDWTLLKDMPGLIPYYGKSIAGYVYK